MNKISYPKLRGRMVEHGISQRQLAERLGISVQALSRKITGKGKFSQKDIVKICKVLDIAIEEIGAYFFTF